MKHRNGYRNMELPTTRMQNRIYWNVVMEKVVVATDINGSR